MALDPKFFISPNLQENFTDKDTGCPLVNGTITFFEDEARTTPKDVFVLSGTVPAYTYTNIGNVVTLNNAGAASYLGTDVRIYYFPFDDEGTSQLYFAEVRSADTILQLTREAWPNITTSSGGGGSNGDSAFTNYIPNGQYLSHNDLVDDGLIVAPITQIGYGNWTFERPVASVSVDNVTFVRFASFITNPESNPRYAIRVVNTGGGAGDGSKDIRVKFDDVNKFGSDEQQFTFKFQGKSTSGSFDVDLVLIKNYGTGGSATTETSLDTFTITGAYQSFDTSFVFGDNITKTIGTLDDDFLQLAIRLPVGIVFEGEFTDFVLIEGEFTDINFPDTTTRQSVSQFIGGSSQIPDYEGRDLYLTERLTPTGKEWDHSQIGFVFQSSVSNIPVGYLLADGDSFLTSDYSVDSIPFRRLQEKYFDTTNLSPIYGTGINYSIAYYPGVASSGSDILFSNNCPGIAAAVVDGAKPTGFTFSSIHDATGIDYGVNSWISSPGNGWVQNKVIGQIHQISPTDLTLNPTPGTSGMGVGDEYLLEGTTYRRNFGAPPQFIRALNVAQEFNISFLDGATLGNGGGSGKYFTYRTTTTAFYVWYHTGAEIDPLVAGSTGIRVNITSSDSVETVAEKTSFAMSNYQSSLIQTIDASFMVIESYFEFTSPLKDYYCWYTIDGAGIDPNVVNRTGVQTDILSTDNADAVARKTISAINSYQFAVPDYRGLILKGSLGSRTDVGLDDDLSIRFSRTNVKYGANNISSEQLSMNRQHGHQEIITAHHLNPGTELASNVFRNDAQNLDYFETGLFTTADGGTYSRPANAYINYVIKY